MIRSLASLVVLAAAALCAPLLKSTEVAAEPMPAAPLAVPRDSACAEVTFVTRPVAVLTVPGIPERHTPTTVTLCEGTHEVRFRAARHDEATLLVSVSADTPQHFMVRLRPQEAR